MEKSAWRGSRSPLLQAAIFNALLFAGGASTLMAQNPEIQQRVADLKESMAKNKQQLAQYTWREQVAISLKGEQKKQEVFQVRMGADGKLQKTPISEPDASASQGGGRNGRVKQHVVEKKKEEFQDYADRMKSLAERYIPPDKDLMQQAQEKGNISISPVAGSASQVQLAIHDYLKSKDSLTLVFDKVPSAPERTTIHPREILM